VVAGLAHALHDGFTDLLYILLPIWQVEFGSGHALVGTLRAPYEGMPAARIVRKMALLDRRGSA